MLPTKRSHRAGHEAKRGGKAMLLTRALQAAMVNVSELHQCTSLIRDSRRASHSPDELGASVHRLVVEVNGKCFHK